MDSKLLVNIQENNLFMQFTLDSENCVRLVHFSSIPLQKEDLKKFTKKGSGFDDGVLGSPVELMVTGLNIPREHEGNKNFQSNVGSFLKYHSMTDIRNSQGRCLSLILFDERTNLEVKAIYQFFDGIPVIQCHTEITNKGKVTQDLEAISSFAYCGIDKEGIRPFDEKCEISFANQSWQRELMWETFTLEQLGLVPSASEEYHHSANSINLTNVGNWSAKEHLPMGIFKNKEAGTDLFWQIEHNGSWHWEISDQRGILCLLLTGPSELESHWWKHLAAGETFVSVPIAIGSTVDGFDGAIQALTTYRRALRRVNADNINLPIIFNDYMNCLEGEPTTEAELPLIDAASKAGCEYYVIDCGWYSDGFWWDTVGEWQEYSGRFPDGGLKKLTEYIKSKGMVSGLWIELEVMGIQCPMVKKVDPTWFFQRRGKSIKTRSRYQLDFRNPEVQDFATKVIDRLIADYGIGYIKMDYNIEPGIGTDYNADSPGDGMLGHERAYLRWLDHIIEKYPDLVIENCGSGGLRMDYALLSRCSIQSTSDQCDYRNTSVIAANAPTGVTPEQAAVWSYPLFDGDEEETAFNMVNAILLRVHQSGPLPHLSDSRMAIVQEGLNCYKVIRSNLYEALPFWPIGPAHYRDGWNCLAMKNGKTYYFAVWRKNDACKYCSLPVTDAIGKEGTVSCLFPVTLFSECSWNKEVGAVEVQLPANMTARLFQLQIQ
jgi:alpha-galactosidase